MPPKKTAATTKVKTVKKKVEKVEEPVPDTKDEEPEKPLKEKVSKRRNAAKEEQTEVDPDKVGIRKKVTKKAEAKVEEKGTTKKKSNAKGEITVDQKEVTSRQKKNTKGNQSEGSAKNKEKPAASKVKKSKKADAEEAKETEAEDAKEDEESEPSKGRKRKAAPRATKKESEKGEPENKVSRTNATSTKWENVNFKCTSKNSNGKTPNFHITSWNVGGLRACIKKGNLDILEHDKPDIFCIQETKCSEDKLPDEAKNIDGYETFWCSSDKEGYAGVGIVTKVKPLNVTYGIDSAEHDTEGRCITAEYENFFLVNVYVPNAGRKLVTLPKRLDWNQFFKAHVKKLDERKPVIVCGDMNVAHTEIDLANPKTNTKNAGFTIEEREGLTDFLEDGYTDTFRQLYPDKEKAYTFWTFMANARAKNVGWRLDYFICSKRLMKSVCDNLIHSDVLGSDHCPISLHLNI